MRIGEISGVLKGRSDNLGSFGFGAEISLEDFVYLLKHGVGNLIFARFGELIHAGGRKRRTADYIEKPFEIA